MPIMFVEFRRSSVACLIAERSWIISSQSPSDAADSMGSALCDIYLIASRLLLPELGADALAHLKKLFSTVYAAMAPKLAYRIFDKTTENSPLRKLLVASLMRLSCSEASEHRLRPLFRPLNPHGPSVKYSAIRTAST